MVDVRIGTLTGTTPEFRTTMRPNHDRRVQAAWDAEVLARIPTLAAA